MVEIESLLIRQLNFFRQCPKTIHAMIEMFQTKNANFQLPNLETNVFWLPILVTEIGNCKKIVT